jgi:hypothetical protein
VVPFAGIIIQIWLMLNIALPWVKDFTGIESTWLTTLIFGIDVFLGLIACMITSVAAASQIKEKFDERASILKT